MRIDWHGHRDRGLDVINSLVALAEGVDRVHACALGIGERVGNTPLDVLLVNLKLLGWIDRDLRTLPDYCRAVADALGVPIPCNYPVIGEDAFETSTGVHAAAIIKALRRGDAWLADRVYSSVPAADCGREQTITIGPMSGQANVVAWLDARGLPHDGPTLERILAAAKASDHVLDEREVMGILAPGRGGIGALAASGLLEWAAMRAGPTFTQPIQTTRTFEAAIENIVEAIERARLGRGDQLPSESDLATQLGISKPTLRQALRVLERAGLLTVRQGKGGGIFVASDLIPSDAILGAVALEEGFIVDVLRGRRVLETAITEFAAAVATRDDFDEIERSIGLLRTHLGDRAMVMRADAMFHRAVVRASHNQTLQAAMRGVVRDLAAIRDSYSGGLGQDERTLAVHVRQLEAMRRGDAAELAAVLDEHFTMLEDAFAAAIGRTRADLFGPAPG